MAPAHRSPLKRLSLTPPARKAQLRERCLQRLKRDRGQLLATLRRPDASVSEEMKRLVAHEQQQQAHETGGASAESIDDLLLMGKLPESDYLEIVHALEDALRQEEEQQPEQELRLAEHMAALEDAELEAMLAGLDLEEEEPSSDETQLDVDHPIVSVLCPICKTNYLHEHEAEDAASRPFISCTCGFTFHVQYVYHSVLEDFQEKVVNAFLAHRDSCCSDPIFDKKSREDADVLVIQCARCGCHQTLP